MTTTTYAYHYTRPEDPLKALGHVTLQHDGSLDDRVRKITLWAVAQGFSFFEVIDHEDERSPLPPTEIREDGKVHFRGDPTPDEVS
jgi:hypothetical protein